MSIPEPPSPRFENSPWATLAASVLFVLGFLIAAWGAFIVWEGVTLDEPGLPGFGAFVAGIGVVVFAIGALQVFDAIHIRRHRPSARYLGIVVGVVGVLFGARGLPSAFTPVYVWTSGDQMILTSPPIAHVLTGLIFFPYLVILIGLILGGRHFRRRREYSP